MSGNGEGEVVELIIGEEEVQGEDGGGANGDEEANKVHIGRRDQMFLGRRNEDWLSTLAIQKPGQEKGLIFDWKIT